MAAVELHNDRDTWLTIRIHRELVHRCYIVGRRHGVSVPRIDLSLTIGPDDIDDFLAVLEEVLCAES